MFYILFRFILLLKSLFYKSLTTDTTEAPPSPHFSLFAAVWGVDSGGPSPECSPFLSCPPYLTDKINEKHPEST